MIETMGKPYKDIDEAVKHILDDVQNRIYEAYQRGVEDGRNMGGGEEDCDFLYWTCSNCNSLVLEHDNFCSNCGVDFRQNKEGGEKDNDGN